MSHFSTLAILLIGLVLPKLAWGQAITVHQIRRAHVEDSQARSWPQPVRNVQHQQVVQDTSTPVFHEGSLIPPNALRSSPTHPHRVIQSPERVQPSGDPSQVKHPHVPHATHPHYWSKYHRPIQPAPARLPLANQRATWKSPYSYGYFGASSKRHWSMHNGYRDRYTEWRLH